LRIVQSLEATEFFLVRFKDNEVIRSPVGADLIVSIGVLAVEVEDENQISLLVYDKLLLFMSHSDELMWLDHRLELDL